MTPMYAEVILPLQLQKALTYRVPDDLLELIEVGHRVEVQLGNKKRYSGIVANITDEYHAVRQPKDIIDLLDVEPLVLPKQIEIWKWIAEYYMCTLGEVMQAALPSGLKLSSETIILLNGDQDLDEWTLNDAENDIIESLYRRNELSIGDIEEFVKTPKVYSLIKGLFEKEIIIIKERLKEKSKPKTVSFISLKPPYDEEEGFLEALEKCSRAPKQTKSLIALYDMMRKGLVKKKDWFKKSGSDSGIMKTLSKKDLIIIEEKLAHEVLFDNQVVKPSLNSDQVYALESIITSRKTNTVTLLHGVTGSGKTHVYIELIEKTISEGKQALFLLPEIALTTQIVQRLKKVFGDKIITYHSRMNDRERTAIWHVVKKGHPIVLGARSSLFLPFTHLGLIIVDEEHDTSYKQSDPAPRYHARDLAVFLSNKYSIPTLLGSATPSIESQRNVKLGKFGYTDLKQRFNEVEMPEIQLIDLKKAYQKKQVIEHFSKEALDAIEKTVLSSKQVLIFQNRRGHSHLTRCQLCGWTAGCIKCDVSLIYHKVFKDIRCHYCGYRESLPRSCPECGNPHLNYTGLGTEKIQEDLRVHFPEYRIARMDLDTARGNKARENIIQQMEDHEYDILIGTQMVTKGLDFEHIELVVVPQADQLLFYPDFRTNEKAYQMLLQVSGRAGRKKEQGKVLIQTFVPNHRVLQALVQNEQEQFYESEDEERNVFHYPPYSRMIRIELKHKKLASVARAADELSIRLKHIWKSRIIGPSEPSVSRVRTYYVRHIHIKYERKVHMISLIKKSIRDNIIETNKLKGLSNVRINVNIDPV